MQCASLGVVGLPIGLVLLRNPISQHHLVTGRHKSEQEIPMGTMSPLVSTRLSAPFAPSPMKSSHEGSPHASFSTGRELGTWREYARFTASRALLCVFSWGLARVSHISGGNTVLSPLSLRLAICDLSPHPHPHLLPLFSECQTITLALPPSSGTLPISDPNDDTNNCPRRVVMMSSRNSATPLSGR
jgi:hypothetical protein